MKDLEPADSVTDRTVWATGSVSLNGGSLLVAIKYPLCRSAVNARRVRTSEVTRLRAAPPLSRCRQPTLADAEMLDHNDHKDHRRG